MAQIPSVTTLKTEDFQGQESWIGNLFLPLNEFLSSAVGIINGNVLFGDNIPTQTQTLTLKPGANFKAITFKYNLKTAPTELRLCSATNNGVATSLLFAWAVLNGQVTLSLNGEVSNGTLSPLSPTATYALVVRLNP